MAPVLRSKLVCTAASDLWCIIFQFIKVVFRVTTSWEHFAFVSDVLINLQWLYMHADSNALACQDRLEAHSIHLV